MLFFIQIL
uniref:Uncharacterized protein n=1 Tax=Rhizophora mucronata TaxID=61149 RepID=A0A2P2JU70_RHIMU